MNYINARDDAGNYSYVYRRDADLRPRDFTVLHPQAGRYPEAVEDTLYYSGEEQELIRKGEAPDANHRYVYRFVEDSVWQTDVTKIKASKPGVYLIDWQYEEKQANGEWMRLEGDSISVAIKGAYGDINQDGSIDARDALEALRHSVQEIILNADQFSVGDVNQDKAVDARDALDILRFSVGEIKAFTALN